LNAFPFSIEENNKRGVPTVKVDSDRPHSGERRSSVGSENHTLKKSNVYLAIKLHKEFTEVASRFNIKELLTRKDVFNLFVNLGYFRYP